MPVNILATDPSRKIDLLATGVNAGADADQQKLVVQALRGYEEISRPFCYELDLLGSTSAALAPTDFVGRPVTIRIGEQNSSPRYVNGFIARFARVGVSPAGNFKYRATVVPFLWFLSRRKNSRIFTNKTVLQIVTEILTEHNFDSRLTTNVFDTTYLTPEYTVQYQETDLDFISRILEHHGLFYYFKHTVDSHSIEVGDSPGNYLGLEQDAAADTAAPNNRTLDDVGNSPDQESYPAAAPGPAVGTFAPVDVAADSTSPPSNNSGTTGNRMWDWREEYQAMPWNFAAADFNPVSGARELGSTTRVVDPDVPAPHDMVTNPTHREWYEFGQGLSEIDTDQTASAVGQALARLRAERADAAAVVCSGTSDHHRMSAGRTIRLSGAGHDSNTEYLVTRLELRARSDEFDTSGPMTPYNINSELISSSVRAIPAATPFRPERVTPKPRIAGPHSAVVLGVAGSSDAINVDRFGRIKVKFHWDRSDGQDNRWVRVSQLSAGGTSRETGGDGTWGAMFIPHVDDEVLVEFIDGDPDRPVVTGRVYREKDSSPVPSDRAERAAVDEESGDVLPINKTRSIIKDAGGNYLMMEEKEDAQQIEFYSPKSGDEGITARIALGDRLNGQTYAEIGGSDDAFENPVDGINGHTSGSIMLSADKTFNMYSGEDFRQSVHGDHFVRVEGNSEVVINGSLKHIKWANETKITLGFTGELYIGFKVGMNIAGTAELSVGEKLEMYLGLKQELCAGLSEEYFLGYKWEYSAGYKKEAGDMKDMDFDGPVIAQAPLLIKKGILMVPGAITALGTKAGSAKASAAAKLAAMSTKTKIAAGVAAGVAVVAAATVGGAVGGTKHQKNGKGWGD